MEEYNPQPTLIAWVQIPTVSHSQDTTIYLSMATHHNDPQQNPTAVWTRTTWGLACANSGGQFSLADSTSNQNNATDNGATATAGQIDGGMAPTHILRNCRNAAKPGKHIVRYCHLFRLGEPQRNTRVESSARTAGLVDWN